MASADVDGFESAAADAAASVSGAYVASFGWTPRSAATPSTRARIVARRGAAAASLRDWPSFGKFSTSAKPPRGSPEPWSAPSRGTPMRARSWRRLGGRRR